MNNSSYFEGMIKKVFRYRLGVFLLMQFFPISGIAQTWTYKDDNGRSYQIESTKTDTVELKALVLKKWQGKGYLDALWDGKGTLSKGSRWKIEGLTLLNSVSFSGKSKLMRLVNAPFDQTRLQAMLSTVAKTNAEDGWWDFELIVDSVQFNTANKGVELFVDIVPGKRPILKNVLFPDSSRPKPAFLRQMSGLELGEPIGKSAIESSVALLKREGIYRRLSFPELYLENDSLVLNFPTAPLVSNQFDGVVGYVPKPTNDGGDIVGEINLALSHFLVDGNTLALHFSRMQALVSRFWIEVGQQQLLELPVSVAGRMDFYQRDTTYQTRDFSVHGSWRLNKQVTIRSGIRNQSTVDGVQDGTTALSDGSAWYSSLALRFDSRNDPIIPTHGWFVDLQTEVGRRLNANLPETTVVPRRERKTSGNVRVRGFFQLSSRQVVSPRLHGYLIQSNFYQESDFLRFGGAQTFRGYSEEQFFAGTMLWGDFEYRFLLDRTTYLFAFLAGGAYERPEQRFDARTYPVQRQTLRSFGFGLAYETRLGLLQFSYAKSPDDPIDNAKIHFGIQGRL